MNTFGRDLEFATLGDLDSLLGLIARKLLNVLDLVDDIVTLEDLSEDNVAAVEPTNEICISNWTIKQRAINKETYEVTTVVMKN